MTWIISILMTKLKIPSWAAKLIIVAAAGLVIFLLVNKYTNYIWDKAEAKTRLSVTAEVAKMVEIQVKAEREKFAAQDKLLDAKRVEVAHEIEALQQARELTRKTLADEIKRANQNREVRDAQITTAVRNIPGDKLDMAIREFITKYTGTATPH